MTTPAGWYPDNNDPSQMRYWDGNSWTSRTQAAGPTPPKPSFKEKMAEASGKAKEKQAAAKEMLAVTRGAVAQQNAESSGVTTTGALFTGTSHDAGRNAVVTLWPDRIERTKAKSFGSLSRANQDAEVTPVKAVSSVQAKKDGLMYTKVTVYASGNNIEFRFSHDEAAKFKTLITNLILQPAHAPAPVVQQAPDVAEQLTKLAALRDQGILTDEEFATQKTKLLG